MDAMRGSSPPKNVAASDAPEQLLDAFKAAALSVTKLYKTSAAAQAKSRGEGYQDCLDDLLAFLDKQNIGLSDGEGWQIRRWATERLDGREGAPQALESEDEVDNKPEAVPSPEPLQSGSATQPPATRPDSHMRTDSAPPTSHSSAVTPISEEPPQFTVPSQEHFTFQSSHPYPQETYPNLATLDLSDSAKSNDNATQGPSTVSVAQPLRSRSNRRGTKPRPASTSHLGKGAGQKRAINYAELFDVGSISFGKDIFGREGKRTRHT
ncbi:hypothetical protein F4780DRAFT_726688 [Xylariomycetidae sp. FL0641]|nr:hypothetical protein F4780DRAFT_726688 [Xylariomycetidae sp. FL0641]